MNYSSTHLRNCSVRIGGTQPPVDCTGREESTQVARMLQSPQSNVFPDSTFGLQTLMHGRNYLSPVDAANQATGGAIDSPQYRGFICHQTAAAAASAAAAAVQRLPHFSLAIPPGDILSQYQPHPAFTQPGFSPPGLLPVRRTHLPNSALENFSKTLFSIGQHHHAHHLPGPMIPPGVGVPLQQEPPRGASLTGGRGVPVGTAVGGIPDDGAVRPESFLRGIPGYFDSADKNAAQDPSLRCSGLSNYHNRLPPVQSKPHVTDKSQLVSSHYSQPHFQPHHSTSSGFSRSRHLNTLGHVLEGVPGNNKEATPLYLSSEKPNAGDTGSWKAPIMHRGGTPEVDFFKHPNAVGISQPPDRPPQRNGFTRYASNPSTASVSPRTAAHGNHSPVTSSGRHLAESGGQGSSPNTYRQGSSPNGYRRHFSKGSVIQLASGQFKRVEDLRTEDFLDSCGVTADLSVDTSRVTHMRLNHDNESAVIGFAVGKKQIKVTVEATIHHPFFVFNRGWSSCCPAKSLDRYGLPCQQLTIGDVCVSLTRRYPNSPSPSPDLDLHRTTGSKVTEGHPGSDKVNATVRSPAHAQSMLIDVTRLSSADRRNEEEEQEDDDDDDDDEDVVTESVVVSGLEQAEEEHDVRTGQSRKRRWSAPDSANDSVPFKVPVLMTDPIKLCAGHAQPPVAA